MCLLQIKFVKKYRVYIKLLQSANYLRIPARKIYLKIEMIDEILSLMDMYQKKIYLGI